MIFLKIILEELKYNSSNEKYSDGYRLVYFYNGFYSIGEYSKTIEGFMLGFCDCYPIMDDSDIPEFISTSDILKRCIKENEKLKKVAIYRTNGELIEEIESISVKNNIHL